MDTDTVEKLLQKAPPLRTPPGLLQALQSDIALSPGKSQITNRESRSASGWFRRWMPALGFGLWFLGCVVAFGIQSGWIAELRERQRTWESAQAAAAQQSLAAEAARVAVATEFEQLRQDLADMQRLRAELQQLRADGAALAELRAQNEQLRRDLASQTVQPQKPEKDFFAMAQDRTIRIKCVSNLKQLGLAGRIWADRNKSDVMPDGVTLKAALPNLRIDEKILVCPSDGTTGYEIVSPGAPESRPEIVFSRCLIHSNFGLNDGSVQQVDPSRVHMVQKDDWWVLEKR